MTSDTDGRATAAATGAVTRRAFLRTVVRLLAGGAPLLAFSGTAGNRDTAPPLPAGPGIRRQARRWLKGNTHTHTQYSDGDSPPETVVDWYVSHGYDFLFLTDHNVLIPDDHLAALGRRGIAVWQGEEVTMGDVHVNGLGLHELIPPHRADSSPAERIRWASDQARAQGGIVTVDHPNFRWAVSGQDLLDSGEFGMLEVANGIRQVNNAGDATHPSTEALWDRVLGAGRQVWGVASDDAHHFVRWADELANPGRGWLQVEADSARMGDVLESLNGGRFYASSGLELAAYEASGLALRLELAGDAATIDLIGSGGTVLETTVGERAQFRLTAAGGYARVRATASDGRQLWTQPVFR